ncbi:hypothetical protein Tco_0420418 [Tanacetum coccineum]
MCMKETSLMLTMLIPGPKSPAKDIDVYLQPLIKELQELWKGVWTKDAAMGTHFQMKAALLWTINDFPARSSLSGWSGQGYYACPTCNVDTPSMAVKNKIAYVGHRRFLRTQHPQRNKFKEYYGSKEPTPKPRKFSELEIQLQISKVLKRRPGKHPDIAKKNPKPNREIELNWSKRSIFWDLEYWPFLKLKHNLDVMHIEKNALEALLNTLLQNDKTKDTVKARQDLETLKVRKELWLVKKPNGKLEKPHPKPPHTPRGTQPTFSIEKNLIVRQKMKLQEVLLHSQIVDEFKPRATLRATGVDAAIKVQRPEIKPIIYQDLFHFQTLPSFLNGMSCRSSVAMQSLYFMNSVRSF